jgi:hypothetical protein
MTAAAPSPTRSRVDPRTLSLVQLHRLAERGSRSARAEIERRLAELPPAAPTPPRSTASHPAPPGPTLAPAMPPAPSTASAPAEPPSGPDPHQALIDQWQLIERQEQAQARSAGPPRLVGWVLVLWGAMLGFGGLVLLAQGGGAYYLLCGAACAGIGLLLARRSRWAMPAHGLLALLALAWAWAGSGLTLAVIQAAPVLLAALWLALPAVRDALD